MAIQPGTRLPLTRFEKVLKQLVSNVTSLYLKHRTKTPRIVFLALIIALINRARNALSKQKTASVHIAQTSQLPSGARRQESQSANRTEIDREFFRRLLRLIKIVIPGWRSKEFRLIISHSIFLIARTLLSLYVAELDGKLVINLIQGNGTKFLRGILWWMIVAVPATFTNSMVSLPKLQF